MKVPRFALWIAIPFILGALCAPQRGTSLEKLLHQKDSHTQPQPEKRPPELAADADPARETRISRVLSALLETNWLKQRHELFFAIGDLALPDLAEMMGRASKLPRQYRGDVLGVIMDRWLELDPVSASKWVHAHPEEDAAWMAWVQLFPKEALAEIHADPWSPSARTRLRWTLFQMAGYEAKEQTLALAALPFDQARNAFLNERFLDWGKKDPAAAFIFSQSSDAGAIQTHVRWRLIDGWAKSDPLQAAQAIDAILPGLENQQAGLYTIANVAAALGGKDLDAAFAWANRLPAEFQDASFAAVASAWAKVEPAAALNWCLENGVNAARAFNFEAGSVIGCAMSREPAQTLEWIQSLPPNADRDALLEQALKSSSALPTETLIGWLSLLSADSQERVVYQIGQQSGNLDTARLLAERLPEGAVRAAAIEAAVKHYWTSPPPENGAKPFQSFPGALDHDSVLSGTALGKAGVHPDAAALDALAIRDPGIRRDVFDSIISMWLGWEPKKARAWLNQTPGIPPDWIAEYREN